LVFYRGKLFLRGHGITVDNDGKSAVTGSVYRVLQKSSLPENFLKYLYFG